jgi:hypothetical protein
MKKYYYQVVCVKDFKDWKYYCKLNFFAFNRGETIIIVNNIMKEPFLFYEFSEFTKEKRGEKE